MRILSSHIHVHTAVQLELRLRNICGRSFVGVKYECQKEDFVSADMTRISSR
jgi:hypothetical protein